MSKSIFFDTDYISSFLWVNEEKLLKKLYPKRIIIPKQVYNELSHPSIPHLKGKADRLCADGNISVKEIITNI